MSEDTNRVRNWEDGRSQSGLDNDRVSKIISDIVADLDGPEVERRLKERNNSPGYPL